MFACLFVSVFVMPNRDCSVMILMMRGARTCQRGKWRIFAQGMDALSLIAE